MVEASLVKRVFKRVKTALRLVREKKLNIKDTVQTTTQPLATPHGGNTHAKVVVPTKLPTAVITEGLSSASSRSTSPHPPVERQPVQGVRRQSSAHQTDLPSAITLVRQHEDDYLSAPRADGPVEIPPGIQPGSEDTPRSDGVISPIFDVSVEKDAPPTMIPTPNPNTLVDNRDPRLAPVSARGTAPTSASESACKRLIRRAFAPHELPSLLEEIFSSKDEADAIRCLFGDDAQTFIDVINEALDRLDISPQLRQKCLKPLYRTCGRHALLPKALKIPICYDRTTVALYRGGFADVWKGKHSGQDVAVKVIRTYSNDNLQRVIGRFCKEVMTWKTLQHPNVLPLLGVMMSENQFAMVSDWMMNGNINDFVKTHSDVNRLELLGDVAKGLIYIHSQGMIHGDLKGANILIDQTGHARLADFGLLTIISDPANFFSSSSYTQGGTARWMGPELIAPQEFGLENCCPTASSDCYSLGMVIYETVSGNLPFHKYADLAVFLKVLKGERPPRGDRFTNNLWKMLEQCWASQPSSRPSIEGVLQCLETLSDLSEPPSPGTDGETEEDNVSEDTFDHDPTAPRNDLPGQESKSHSQTPSISLSLPPLPPLPPYPWTRENSILDPSIIPDVSSFMGNLDTRTPQGDSSVMDGPQPHIIPAAPIPGELWTVVSVVNNPAETLTQVNPRPPISKNALAPIKSWIPRPNDTTVPKYWHFKSEDGNPPQPPVYLAQKPPSHVPDRNRRPHTVL